MDDRVWHYLSPNEGVRVPRRHVFLDTEAPPQRTPGGHVQEWLLGVACLYAARKGRAPRERWSTYRTLRELWEDVDAFCGRSGRTVLWTHNLSYDVRIAHAFDLLPLRGWSLAGHNLAPRGTWLCWRRGRTTLLMVDSASVYPTTLAKVGAAFGLGKLAWPSDVEDAEAWQARCRQDVEILRHAVLAYLDWIEHDDLGNWQMTGAGQAYTTFRHRFLSGKILVHDDPGALRAERRAMWTGRCEAFWHGALHGQVVHEWDLSLAYARVAADVRVPVRLLGPMPAGYDWLSLRDSAHTAFLAQADITTDVPVVPAEVDGRIAWPVGTFTSTLWDVEIFAALDAGATVNILYGWFYRKTPALKAWADWVISRLEAPDADCPAWQKIILKHWSRALIGRFACTYTQWEDYATAPTVGTRRSVVYDRDTGGTFEIMQVGRDVWRDAGRVEWSQSCPAITGYIQAATRVRLWRIMQALPREAVLYVDTDSILCTDRHLSTVDAVARSGTGRGLRLKRSWDGFAIYGPRQVVTGRQVRIAGLPHAARRVGRHQFVGEVWQSLATALRRGSHDRVLTRDRTWNVRCVDNRRVGGPVGWTQPHRVPAAA